MKPSELQEILNKPAMKAKNQHLIKHGVDVDTWPIMGEPKPKPAKRIRQSQKPVLNKLEQEWFHYLSLFSTSASPKLRAQAKRYKIGNGIWYKPDITCTAWRHLDSDQFQETAWEVKGPKQMKGIARGMVVLKAAAHCWPEVRFILVWKENGNWQEQIVLP